MNFWKEGVKENKDPVRDTGDGGGFSSDSLQGVLGTRGRSSLPQESPAPELHCCHPPHLQEEATVEGERGRQGDLVLPLPVSAGPSMQFVRHWYSALFSFTVSGQVCPPDQNNPFSPGIKQEEGKA